MSCCWPAARPARRSPTWPSRKRPASPFAGGQFELDCTAATGQVISRETLQPVVQTFRYSGPDRAEFTVGVVGCGERATYVVICPDNGSGSCFAGAGRMGGR